jgi:hypothetical protein
MNDDWIRFSVHQQRPFSGCIPTGYEYLCRSNGLEEINYNSFQDDFDFDKDLSSSDIPQNNLYFIKEKILEIYPNINIKVLSFGKNRGKDKYIFVQDLVNRGIPVIVSLNLQFFGQNGWHIMPVVGINDDTITLIHDKNMDGVVNFIELRAPVFIDIHNNYDGGDDVAYIEQG